MLIYFRFCYDKCVIFFVGVLRIRDSSSSVSIIWGTEIVLSLILWYSRRFACWHSSIEMRVRFPRIETPVRSNGSGWSGICSGVDGQEGAFFVLVFHSLRINLS